MSSMSSTYRRRSTSTGRRGFLTHEFTAAYTLSHPQDTGQYNYLFKIHPTFTIPVSHLTYASTLALIYVWQPGNVDEDPQYLGHTHFCLKISNQV